MPRADVLGRAPGQAASGMGQTDMFRDYPDLLTPAHVAEITGMSAHTVRDLCRKGEIPAAKIGAKWFVPKGAFIARCMGTW